MVRNRTRDVVLSQRTRVADTVLSRMKGLLGANGLPQGDGLWIEPCNSIHTWFMKFTIDAVFVDRGGRVVKLVERMKPWKLTAPARGARAVLELPEGTIGRTGTKVGDEVTRT